MEMLVTKFSKGKYRNEGELFNEPISAGNVKLMGEMIALQALRTVKKYDMKIADKLYIGLIKDLHHMNEIDYIVSDGYDVAQTAICFLYQFTGRKASEIYGKDRKGKEITIKLACYREVDHFINLGYFCVIGRPVDLDHIFRCRFPFHFVTPFNPKVLIMDFITSASFPSREGKSLSNNSFCSSLR